MIGAVKTRYPRATALAVAKELCDILKPHCERLIVAGSLRRRKESVGDVEILYIPKVAALKEVRTAEMFDTFKEAAPTINWVEASLNTLLTTARLLKRKNVNGSETWGQQNKYATHSNTSMPVDFFSACEANWFNYLVCRTGSAENNTAIATAAQGKGWKWNPYGVGFTNDEGGIVRVRTEAEAFTLVGLAYKEPWER